MAQIFHPSANTIAKGTIFGFLILAGAAAYVTMEVNRSPYVTQVDVARAQPVPFSHEHHVGGLGIDCRYCHNTVEESKYAGMPSTKTCMTCHSQIWTNAQILEPVRASWRDNEPIRWTRVHDLPDYVQFNHSIHVNKGVGCYSCHGEVDKMPLMWKENTLQMEWCLKCHRDPGPNLRPIEKVFDMRPYEPGPTDPTAEDLKKFYQISTDTRVVDTAAGLPHEKQPNPLTNCSVCHY